MLGYVDSYYKSQMNRFLKLKDDLVNEDIKVLERVLYTLNTAKTYKIQENEQIQEPIQSNKDIFVH